MASESTSRKRPKSYTNFYKSNSRTPGSFDDEEEGREEEVLSPRLKRTVATKSLRERSTADRPVVSEDEKDLRKQALRNRLKALRSKRSSTKVKSGLTTRS